MAPEHPSDGLVQRIRLVSLQQDRFFPLSASCVPILPLLLPLLMHLGERKVDKRNELCIRN